MDSIRDSVCTSLTLKIFKNEKDAAHAHLFKSEKIKVPITLFSNVVNFNPERLQNTAKKSYPINDRPRGNRDLSSVKQFQRKIQQNEYVEPIWLVLQSNKYVLLDGAHRLVASHIEGKRFIEAYIINTRGNY